MMGQEGVQAGWNGVEMSSNNVTNKMLVDGKQWVYRHHVETWNWELMWPEKVDTKVTYTLSGDTLIKYKHYKKLYRQEEDEAPVYDRALRESGKRVYCYGYPKEEDLPLIEFNPIFFTPSFVNPYFDDLVDRIDEVTVNDRTFTRHRYYKKGSDDWRQAFYAGVEGVGFEYTGILGMNFAMTPSNYITFEACYEDGECIFTAEDFEKPGNDSDGVEAPLNVQHSTFNVQRCFDLQGRRLTGQPKPGIYIVDGKKHVVK
ncbi:MAG: hypothetical protein J5552_02395 [Prevotella sp.]|nr:hypothetical protein [Prevotella sp.]